MKMLYWPSRLLVHPSRPSQVIMLQLPSVELMMLVMQWLLQSQPQEQGNEQMRRRRATATGHDG
jgi:hypothetical protein